MYYDLLVVVVLVFFTISIVTFSLVQVLLNDILSEITSKSKGTFFSNDRIFPLKIRLLSSHHISVTSITCNSS